MRVYVGVVLFSARIAAHISPQLEDLKGNIIQSSQDAILCDSIVARASESEAFLVSEESLAIASQVRGCVLHMPMICIQYQGCLLS